MMSLLWLLPITLALGLGGVALFTWTVRSGQYDDLDGAAYRILNDDDPPRLDNPPRLDDPGPR